MCHVMIYVYKLGVQFLFCDVHFGTVIVQPSIYTQNIIKQTNQVNNEKYLSICVSFRTDGISIPIKSILLEAPAH